MTHYDVLGVASDAPADELRRAYLREARRWHPDAHAGGDAVAQHAAARRMQLVNEAWRVVGDARRRYAYDLELGRIRPAWEMAGDVDDEEELDWLTDLDAVEADGRGTPFAIVPVMLVALSIASFCAALVINLTPLLVLSLASMFLGGVLFVVMPFLAMAEARRVERRNES